MLLIVPLVGAAFAMEMDWSYIGIAAVIGGVLGFLLRTWLVKLSKSQLERLYVPLMQSLADADGLNAYCRNRVNAQHQEVRRRLSERRDLELKRAEEAHRKSVAEGESQRDERLRKINEVYAERMVEVQTTQQRDLRKALEDHDRRIADLKAETDTGFPRLETQYKDLKERILGRYESDWRAMADRWREGMDHAIAELAAINREVNGYCPALDNPVWGRRNFPAWCPQSSASRRCRSTWLRCRKASPATRG